MRHARNLVLLSLLIAGTAVGQAGPMPVDAWFTKRLPKSAAAATQSKSKSKSKPGK
jgi:hypothetical protein